MTLMVRGMLLIAVLAFGGPAAAQYWISVGSFRDADTAQAGVEALASRVSVPLTVTRYEAAGVYRIVMGPYVDVAGAQEALAVVRKDAVPDAWIVTEAGGTLDRPADPPQSSPTQTSSSSSVDIEALLRLARAPLPEPGPMVAPQTPDVEGPIEPVTTAPVGYQLHKLRRADLQ